MRYFPDYLDSQIPDRQFMYSIISSTYPNALKVLISDAKKKRSLVENNDDNEIIEMKPEIKEVSTFVLTINTATSGRVAFMLKKGAKLKTKRQAYKKHNTDLKMLCRDN